MQIHYHIKNVPIDNNFTILNNYLSYFNIFECDLCKQGKRPDSCLGSNIPLMKRWQLQKIQPPLLYKKQLRPKILHHFSRPILDKITTRLEFYLVSEYIKQYQ